MADNAAPKGTTIEYLTIIQGNISRMSTASALFKGFAATILAGVVTIAFKDINPVVLLVMLLPLLGFLMLDIYYLSLEKRYRYLYSQVLSGGQDCNFDMDVSSIDSKDAEATIGRCLRSPSITLFYIPVFLAFVLLVVMRFAGFE